MDILEVTEGPLIRGKLIKPDGYDQVTSAEDQKRIATIFAAIITVRLKSPTRKIPITEVTYPKWTLAAYEIEDGLRDFGPKDIEAILSKIPNRRGLTITWEEGRKPQGKYPGIYLAGAVVVRMTSTVFDWNSEEMTTKAESRVQELLKPPVIVQKRQKKSSKTHKQRIKMVQLIQDQSSPLVRITDFLLGITPTEVVVSTSDEMGDESD